MNIPLARYWSILSEYLEGQRVLFGTLVVVLCSSIGFTLVIPQITRLFVDGAAEGVELSELIWLAVLFIGAAFLAQLLTIGATWVGEVVAWNATNKLRAALAEHCLGLDMAFHKGRTPGR